MYFVSASILFFVLSNLGIWLVGSMYPKNLAGLGACYIAALPFLKNQLFGDFIYGGALFGIFQLIERRFPFPQKEAAQDGA